MSSPCARTALRCTLWGSTTGGGRVKVTQPRAQADTQTKLLLLKPRVWLPLRGSFPGEQRMLRPQGTRLFGPILDLTHRILGSFS